MEKESPILIDPLFCFSPSALLEDDRFYLAWGFKLTGRKDTYVFSYLISKFFGKDEDIDTKVLESDSELFNTKDEIIDRYFKFIAHFPEHDRWNNQLYIALEQASMQEVHTVVEKWNNFIIPRYLREFRVKKVENKAGAGKAKGSLGFIEKFFKKKN